MKTKTFTTGVATLTVGASLLSFGIISASTASADEQGNRPQLTEEQRSTLRGALQSKDFEKAEELFAEYGIKSPIKGKGSFGKHQQKKPFAEGQKNKEAIDAAIKSGDYATWKTLIPEGNKMAEVITEENFSLLQEIHAARENQDFEKVKELHEKLGLPMPNAPHEKGGMGIKENEAALAALEAGDFEAFKSALPQDAKILEKITAENFPKFVELHTLQKKVKTLREELGLGDSGGMIGGHPGMHKGMGNKE